MLVRDGEVVGEGWYAGRGSPHAEVAALAAAGERARGATLYVSLEPCSHHGPTPPCADAVVAAGVARVVAAVGDPNPKVDGRGFERLRAAGVEVEVAELWAARVQNEAWRVWIARGRPFVTYKVGGHARRARDRAGLALGLGRGEPPPRARAAGGGRTRSRSGWARCGRTTRR